MPGFRAQRTNRFGRPAELAEGLLVDGAPSLAVALFLRDAVHLVASPRQGAKLAGRAAERDRVGALHVAHPLRDSGKDRTRRRIEGQRDVDAPGEVVPGMREPLVGRVHALVPATALGRGDSCRRHLTVTFGMVEHGQVVDGPSAAVASTCVLVVDMKLAEHLRSSISPRARLILAYWAAERQPSPVIM